MKKILESTALIKNVKPKLSRFKFGDRTLYRDIFNPIVRPNFMLTRFMLTAPEKGRPIEKYSVMGGIRVEIFKIPGKTRHIYHIIPEEFRLSEDKFNILDAARRYLAEHRPAETEFTEPERTREVFMNIGRDLIKDIATRMHIELSEKEVVQLATILTRYTAGFGVLELLLADERIQDIYINSPIGSMPIYIYHSDFEECETNLIPTRDDAEAWATRFRLYSGRPLDEANPVLDTELLVPGGRARVTAITRTLSPEGLAFSFRRHREKPWTLPLFMKAKMFDPLYAGVLSFIIDGGRNILIAGGRSSGKTSLLGAVITEILPKYRILVSEDTLELPITQLRREGFLPEEIDRALTQALRTAVSEPEPAKEPSGFKLPTLEDIKKPEQTMPEVPETALPETYYQQSYPSEDYVDAIVEARVAEVSEKINEFAIKYQELDKKVDSINQQLIELLKGGKQEQILTKMDNFHEAVGEVDLRLGSLEKAFKETLPALIESVRALSDLVQRLKKEG